MLANMADHNNLQRHLATLHSSVYSMCIACSGVGNNVMFKRILIVAALLRHLLQLSSISQLSGNAALNKLCCYTVTASVLLDVSS